MEYSNTVPLPAKNLKLHGGRDSPMDATHSNRKKVYLKLEEQQFKIIQLSYKQTLNHTSLNHPFDQYLQQCNPDDVKQNNNPSTNTFFSPKLQIPYTNYIQNLARG